jgi:hypothetical protein
MVAGKDGGGYSQFYFLLNGVRPLQNLTVAPRGDQSPLAARGMGEAATTPQNSKFFTQKLSTSVVVTASGYAQSEQIAANWGAGSRCWNIKISLPTFRKIQPVFPCARSDANPPAVYIPGWFPEAKVYPGWSNPV